MKVLKSLQSLAILVPYLSTTKEKRCYKERSVLYQSQSQENTSKRQ